MKNIWICLALILTISFTTYAQSLKPIMNIGPAFDVNNDKELVRHLHSDATGHYLYFKEVKTTKVGFLRTTTTHFLEKYDADFKLVFSKAFKRKGKDDKSILSFRSYNGNIFYFSAENSTPKKEINYSLTPVDKDGNELAAKEVTISKSSNNSTSQNRYWSASPDSSKILFATTSGNRSKKDVFAAYFWVFDKEMNVLWKKGVSLPIAERKIETSNFKVSNKGEVFFLGKVYEKNRKTEPGTLGNFKQQPHQLDLFKLTSKGSDLERALIASKEDFMKSYGLILDKNNDALFLGLYGNSQKGPNIGLHYQRYNATTSKLAAPTRRPYTAKELSTFGSSVTSKDSKSRKTGIDKGYKINELIIKPTGDILVITEENKTRTTATTSTTSSSNPVSSRISTSSMTRTRDDYISNHLIVHHLSPEGKVKQVKLIPKKQELTGSKALSYKSLFLNDEVLYLYYDNNDNLTKNITDPKKYKKLTRLKSCALLLSSINEKGKLQKNRVKTNTLKDGLVMPEYTKKIGDHTFLVILAISGKRNTSSFRLGTLTLK